MKAKRIVVKIGSALLVDEAGNLRRNFLESLIKDVALLKQDGVEVIIVSSGAIALGKFAFKRRIDTVALKQAAASVGQIDLMASYREIALKNGLITAQILLSAKDICDRQSYDNLQNIFHELILGGIVAIVNENDSVAVDEIKIGDNDRLAARVAQIVSADLLILFSDIDGLYDKNPKIHKDARFISKVDEITKEIESMAGGVVSSVGSGGMITKITAAKMANLAGCDAIVTSGFEENCLSKLFFGDKKFTLFASGSDGLKHRKKWLSGLLEAKGEVIVNAKAREILLQGEVSLLPVGIVAAFGGFKAGDLVFVRDEKGNHIASGVANYDNLSLKKVLEMKGDEVKRVLGIAKVEFIHIDNLVIG